jgi:hypothetical protein
MLRVVRIYGTLFLCCALLSYIDPGSYTAAVHKVDTICDRIKGKKREKKKRKSERKTYGNNLTEHSIKRMQHKSAPPTA